MTEVSTHKLRCGACQQDGSVALYSAVNVTQKPELRAAVMDDTLNVFHCAGCGTRLQFIQSVLYQDAARGFAVWFLPGMTEEDYCAFLEGHTGGPMPPLTAEWEDFKQTILLWENSPARAAHAPRPRSDEDTPDFAREALATLRERLQIDPQWSRSESGARPGFVWWAGPLAQTITAEPCGDDAGRPDAGRDDAGRPGARLMACTDLLLGWENTPEQSRALAPLLAQTTLSGLTRAPENMARLQLTSSVFLREDDWEWLAEWMAWVASVQVAEAHTLAEPLALMTGMRVAASAHPQNGPRTPRDPVLGMAERVLIPAGQKPARWQGRDIMDLLKRMPHPPCLSSRAGRSSLTAEFPFGQGVSQLHLSTDAPHRLGSGLSVRLTLPRKDAETDAGPQSVADALALNERTLRAAAGLHFLGSWHENAGQWTHLSFVPNALYAPGALFPLVEDAMARTRWATRAVFGEFWHDGQPLRMGAK